MRKKRERSPTPKAARAQRIHIGRLTRNVTKEHVHEIFSNYGKYLEFFDAIPHIFLSHFIYFVKKITQLSSTIYKSVIKNQKLT